MQKVKRREKVKQKVNLNSRQLKQSLNFLVAKSSKSHLGMYKQMLNLLEHSPWASLARRSVWSLIRVQISWQ